MTMQAVGVATAPAGSRRHQRVRTELLALHRALIAEERRDYELLHGRVGAGGFLQALVNEPELQWLAPYTSVLTELDQDELPENWDTLRGQLRQLLRLESRYGELFDRSPDVSYAHAATLFALRG
ncbi:MAG TPA: hypothetical protein VFX59_15140 [Polyangiales bacterium]|nr:hypothetical protein [Polyangiales bacterium]